LICTVFTRVLAWALTSTLVNGITVPVAFNTTAMSRTSALTVVTLTGGPGGVAGTAPEAADTGEGADAVDKLGAGVAAEAGVSASFFPEHATKPRVTTTPRK
jgi:hypothetical protein